MGSALSAKSCEFCESPSDDPHWGDRDQETICAWRRSHAEVEARMLSFRKLVLDLYEGFDRDAGRCGWSVVEVKAWARELELALRGTKPVPMVLYCPRGHPHIDEGEWATRPHKTHLCTEPMPKLDENGGGLYREVVGYEPCGLEWRPAHFPTVGVKEL